MKNEIYFYIILLIQQLLNFINKFKIILNFKKALILTLIIINANKSLIKILKLSI